MNESKLWNIKKEVYIDLEKRLSEMKISESEKCQIQSQSIEVIENFWLKAFIHLIDSQK